MPLGAALLSEASNFAALVYYWRRNVDFEVGFFTTSNHYSGFLPSSKMKQFRLLADPGNLPVNLDKSAGCRMRNRRLTL